MTTDILGSAGAHAALNALAKSYGITPDQLDAVVAQVVPALSNRIERNTLSRGGLSDLVAEFARPGHLKALTDPNFAASPAAIDTGNHALDTVFGSKATSRNIAAQAAMSTGIQQAIIQKLLPIIASMVMAALAKNTQGGLGDILKKLPDIMGGGMPQPSAPSRRRQSQPQQDAEPNWPQQGSQNPDLGGLGDILSKIPGFPGSQQTGTPMQVPGRTAQAPQPPMFPQPQGDTGFGGGGGGGSPLPLPGESIPGVNAPNDNPFGNLPDVIRRGGQSVDGRSLGDVVRGQVGSSLGFPSTGIIGWIIRLIVLRWGWGLVTGILRRFLTGR